MKGCGRNVWKQGSSAHGKPLWRTLESRNQLILPVWKDRFILSLPLFQCKARLWLKPHVLFLIYKQRCHFLKLLGESSIAFCLILGPWLSLRRVLNFSFVVPLFVLEVAYLFSYSDYIHVYQFFDYIFFVSLESEDIRRHLLVFNLNLASWKRISS